jgi:predicted secreted hydrolase
MASDATGWDWCGLNMHDGRALMAFRMRDKNGDTVFAPSGDAFEVLKSWTSPRSQATYPVSMNINGYTLEPLMEDQEVDARASTGAIYWEGAVRALRDGREAGRGYLELTGYWKPMKL